MYRTKAGIILAEVFPIVKPGYTLHPQMHNMLPLPTLKELVKTALDAAISSGHRFTAAKA